MSDSQENTIQDADDTEATGSGDDNIDENPHPILDSATDATNAVLDTPTESQRDEECPTSLALNRRGSRKRKRVSYYGQFENN